MFKVEGMPYDKLGVDNGFRKTVRKLVVDAAESGKGISFASKTGPNQLLIDSIIGKSGNSLASSILQSEYPENSDSRLSLFRYLLRGWLCYVEIPTARYDKNSNTKRNTYQKFLATSNVGVVAEWLGVSYEEADSAYGARLAYVDDASYWDDDNQEFCYVKLSRKKDGPHVVRPRKNLDLSAQGMRVVPLFAFKDYVDYLYSKGQGSVLRIHFKKDDGNKRVIDTTFSAEKLQELYQDSNFVEKVTDSWYEGDLLAGSSLDRGYIRVAEVGSSRFDSGVRAVSYTRIDHVEYDVEPDMSLVSVQFNSLVWNFQKGLTGRSYYELEEIVKGLELGGINIDEVDTTDLDSYALGAWAERQEAFFSTTFLRLLAKFMLANSQWFTVSGGVESNSSKGSVLIEEDDLGLGSLDDLL